MWVALQFRPRAVMGFRNKDQSLLHSGVNATISKLITVTFQLPRLKNCLWLCDVELSLINFTSEN